MGGAHISKRRRGWSSAAFTATLCAANALAPSGLAWAQAGQPQPTDAAPAETPPARAFTVVPTVGIQETFTDNVALTSQNQRSDVITRLLLAVDADLDTGRATGRLAAEAGYDAYANQTDRSGWSIAGSGGGSYDLVQDVLALKANGAITNGAISTFGASATDRHGTPQRIQLTTYDVGPELTLKPGDRVEIDAAARYAQVLYAARGASDLQLPRDDSMVQLVGAARFGDDQLPVELRASGEYLHDDQGYRSENGIGSAFVRIARGFRLIARAGYESITQAEILRIRAPVLSAGVELRPNSRSIITAEGGERYHHTAWAAQAIVQLSDRVYLAGGYSEAVQPDQVTVARSFQAFAEAGAQLPPPIAPNSWVIADNLYNETSFYKSGQVRALYQGPVNSLSVGADWTDRRFLTTVGRDRTVLADAHYTRRMRPDLTLVLRAAYAHTLESQRFGPSQTYSGSAQLIYRLNSRTEVSASVARTDNRQLFGGGERIRENAALIALRRSF